MRVRIKRFWCDRRGASMVELAIVLPILLGLVAGLWEFGRIYDAYLVATNAAREGARWAALGYDQAAVQQRVGNYLDTGYGYRLSTGEMSVGTVTLQLLADPANGYPTPGVPGAPARVAVPVEVSFFMSGILGLGNSITLTGRATMPLQMASG